MPKLNDLAGKRFGKLLVLSLDPERAPDRQARWTCRCDCGAQIVAKAGHLRSGSTRSCTSGGCQKNNINRHPLYRRWLNMIYRCTKPTAPDYSRYGGRGIRVCERWLAFENFLADMEPEYQEGLTLDRENNDGDYEPSNCRWATLEEQGSNKRTTVWLETPFGRMTQANAAKRANLPLEVFDNRYRKGWTVERLFGLNSAKLDEAEDEETSA